MQTHIARRDLERHRHYLTLLEPRAATPRPPKAFNLPGFIAYSPPFVDAPIPRLGLPKLSPATRTWYEKPGSTEGPVLESAFWNDDDPRVMRSVMAELVAGLELKPRPVQLGRGQAYATPSGTAVFVLLPGAVARPASIGPTPMDVVTMLSSATPV